jgi:hypothetical protein
VALPSPRSRYGISCIMRARGPAKSRRSLPRIAGAWQGYSDHGARDLSLSCSRVSGTSLRLCSQSRQSSPSLGGSHPTRLFAKGPRFVLRIFCPCATKLSSTVWGAGDHELSSPAERASSPGRDGAPDFRSCFPHRRRSLPSFLRRDPSPRSQRQEKKAGPSAPSSVPSMVESDRVWRVLKRPSLPKGGDDWNERGGSILGSRWPGLY